jgi:hypothetical protein
VSRAGSLRYWLLTLVGLLLALGSIAAVVWGTWNLFETGTCASGGPYVSARPCPDDTWLHITAVVMGPFAGMVAMVVWALRGGAARPSRLLRPFRRRERRVADMVARGQIAAPAVARPTAPPPPPAPWPPRTWDPPASMGVPGMATPASGNPIERLQRLGELREKGLITGAEFEVHKRRILGGI